jgi:iron(III) transport system substrate-binding protein
MYKIILILMFVTGVANAAEINVLTDRSDFHLENLVNQYNTTNRNGDVIQLHVVKKGLLERANSGEYDAIISKNSSEVIAAKYRGLLKPISSYILYDVDSNFKDDSWFLMSYRIRAIYVKKGMENPPLSYSDLAKPEYKDKICIRKLTHNYNLEMFGTMLNDMGEETFIEWFKSFKSNLARTPSGNDRNQVKGVYEGECEIAIANTYYMGLMLDNPKQKAWADSTTMYIPSQGKDDVGAIALYAGVATVKHSDNIETFYNYLLSGNTQKGLSVYNYEYPIDSSNASEKVFKYGEMQGLNVHTIKLRPSIQNDLFELRKKVWKIIKSTH